MGTYIKYLIFFALLCSCVNLKGQDVNFSVVLNGNIVNYTVQNNTSKDMYIIQHREPTMENGSHCLITYKDKDGNVNYEMLPVINKFLYDNSPSYVVGIETRYISSFNF